MIYTQFYDTLDELLKHTTDRCHITDINHKKLLIKPKLSMAFPANEISQVYENEMDLIVECTFLGLYGVDSPLPPYLNQWLMNSDEFNSLFRQFLDIFHHRNYILVYLAHKHTSEYSPSSSKAKLINAFSNYQEAGYPFPIKPTQLSLKRMICYFFPGIEVEIEQADLMVNIENKNALGANIKLGDNAMLGNLISYKHAKFIFNFKSQNLEWLQKVLRPDNQTARMMMRLLKKALGPHSQVIWCFNFLQTHASKIGCAHFKIGRAVSLGEKNKTRRLQYHEAEYL